MRNFLILCAVLAGLVTWTTIAGSKPNAKVTLTFIWHAGDRANLFQKIARQYTEETGVEIKAVLPPMTNEWYERIAGEFARKGAGFDLCIFDSQNMSEFASQGHVVRLNDWLKQSRKISAADFAPSVLKRYAEYPENSGNIYALPINQDCMGLVYRRDLFDDPKEKSAFKAKYGYELAVPETYDQLRDIAEFFHEAQSEIVRYRIVRQRELRRLHLGLSQSVLVLRRRALEPEDKQGSRLYQFTGGKEGVGFLQRTIRVCASRVPERLRS